MSAFVELDTIIRDACSRDGDNFFNTYARRLNHMSSALSEMSYSILGKYGVERIVLTIEDGRVYFPEDYIKYTAISVVDNGNVVALAVNPAMFGSYRDECGNRLAVAGGNEQVTSLSFPNYYNQQNGIFNGSGYYGGSYTDASAHGAGWSERGQYKVHEKEGYVDFSSDFPLTEIVLDYVCKAFKPGKKNLVPVFLTEALINYDKWKHSERFDKSMLQYWRREYYSKRADAWKNMNSGPYYETQQALKKSFGFYPKL